MLSRRLCDEVRKIRGSKRQDLFLTHRVFVVDGSTFSMPDTGELQKEFGQHKAQDRIEPRVVKRRQKPYALMNRPRQEMREALKKQAQTG